LWGWVGAGAIMAGSGAGRIGMNGSLELGFHGVAEAGAAVASASVATMPVAMRWVGVISTCLLWLGDRRVRSVWREPCAQPVQERSKPVEKR